LIYVCPILLFSVSSFLSPLIFSLSQCFLIFRLSADLSDISCILCFASSSASIAVLNLCAARSLGAGYCECDMFGVISDRYTVSNLFLFRIDLGCPMVCKSRAFIVSIRFRRPLDAAGRSYVRIAVLARMRARLTSISGFYRPLLLYSAATQVYEARPFLVISACRPRGGGGVGPAAFALWAEYRSRIECRWASGLDAVSADYSRDGGAPAGPSRCSN